MEEEDIQDVSWVTAQININKGASKKSESS